MILCFSLAAFRILLFPLIFAIWSMICLDINLFVFILFGTLSACCIWISISFLDLKSFKPQFLHIYFQSPFLFLFLLESLLCEGWHDFCCLMSLVSSAFISSFIYLFLVFFFFLLYFALQYCIGFAIHWNLSFCLLFGFDFHYAVFKITYSFFCVI